MKCVNSNYSKYQKYFNICLREWYYQHKNGSYYYYANIPGILFTPLKYCLFPNQYLIFIFTLIFSPKYYFRINKRLNNSQILSNCAELHFNKFPLAKFDNISDIKRALHIGYDISFFKLFLNYLPQISDTYNFIYCNTYDTLFNIYYKYSKRYKIDINSKFDNLTLLSGNLLNLQHLFNSQYFKCVVLYINSKNFKEILNKELIDSFHKILTSSGYVIVVTNDINVNNNLNLFFNKDWISGILGDKQSGNEDLRLYVGIKEKLEILDKIIFVHCYYKLNNNKPNQNLNKIVPHKIGSTSYLISEQCDLINSGNGNTEGDKNTGTKRVHNILKQQLNLLNSNSDPDPETDTNIESAASSVSRSVKRRSKPPTKSKNIKTDKNFIDLLTGDKATKAQTDTSFKFALNTSYLKFTQLFT
uniref:Uncharacterized protein n=1 Tax=Theileria annulata TaxID=5874 RepID=A0A3B0MIR5_THEAN